MRTYTLPKGASYKKIYCPDYSPKGFEWDSGTYTSTRTCVYTDDDRVMPIDFNNDNLRNRGSVRNDWGNEPTYLYFLIPVADISCYVIEVRYDNLSLAL